LTTGFGAAWGSFLGTTKKGVTAKIRYEYNTWSHPTNFVLVELVNGALWFPH